jgi:CO/xanthine dehydrogenase Mo-binding subunit
MCRLADGKPARRDHREDRGPEGKMPTRGSRSGPNGEGNAAGIDAAVADAVFHVTGRRVRELPITPDKLV